MCEVERGGVGSLSCGDELLDIPVKASYGEGGEERNGKGKVLKWVGKLRLCEVAILEVVCEVAILEVVSQW